MTGNFLYLFRHEYRPPVWTLDLGPFFDMRRHKTLQYEHLVRVQLFSRQGLRPRLIEPGLGTQHTLWERWKEIYGKGGPTKDLRGLGEVTRGHCGTRKTTLID